MREGFLPHDSFLDLVRAAVERIVATDDLDDFLGWFGGEVYQQCLLARAPVDATGAKLLAAQLGRSIWGATPAPHNEFRPQPLPKPGRNAPCYCGSGVKYKRCCARFPALPSLGPTEIWPTVLDALPRRDCMQVVASGRVPVESLIIAAEESGSVGNSRQAIGFLEPLFGDRIAGTGHQYDYALSLLCDLYDDAGWTGKKTRLLERIVAEAPRSELRSGAFQRIATIRMDRGDRAGSWEAFRRAQRDTPGDPTIGMLEVHLLLGENRPGRARERARFWRRRLIKLNDAEFEGAIGFLTAVARDPYRAMAQTAINATGGAGQRIFDALPSLKGRPLPRYELVAVPALDPVGDPEAAIARQLRGMGVPEKDISAMAPELLEQARNLERGGDPPGEVPDEQFTLEAPERLRVLEADWHAIYSPGKPFSVDEVPRQDAFPWDLDAEDVWMGFLDRHPEAFDSIDILDDLANAVELHPMSDSIRFREAMQAPLVERGACILQQAVAEAGMPGGPNLGGQHRAEDADGGVAEAGMPGGPNLPWVDALNRPGLRCLARVQSLAMERDDVERAQTHAELLLALNPGDNHGMRTSLMNIYLKSGQDEAAVALASRYEDDMFAELPYGRVLALVRMGRRDAASEAARLAVERLPEVRRYLMRERARQPRMHPYGVAIGSKEQAWLYRDEMREVWVAEPEAMALIRRTRPSPRPRGD